jgi:hypothetical protein
VETVMHAPRVPQFRLGERRTCSVAEVLRNHHDSMPGDQRDRPGFDRVRLQLSDGEPLIADLWSSGEQDVSAVSGPVEIFDDGELLRWSEV